MAENDMQNQAKQLAGEQALQSQVGERFSADWKSDQHRERRLVSEFIGLSGMTFFLSGGASILAQHGGADLAPFQFAFILSAIAALWIMVAVYFLGDISAHFNPAMTLAFAIRGDMGKAMALTYIVVQYIAAAAGSSLALYLFGEGGNLAATMPKEGLEIKSLLFEAVLTFGMVLLVLSMANGPKLNGPFVPIAVGGYIMAAGTMGGPFDGAAFNPARAFGPDFALGNFTGYWIYPAGSLIGVIAAVITARFLRGPAKAQESQAAMGTPLNRGD
jgi:glycerol uptake facilitator-like aquaporin